MSDECLVLWGVPRILVQTGEFGTRTIEQVCSGILGGPVELSSLESRTDNAILLEALRRSGVPDERLDDSLRNAATELTAVSEQRRGEVVAAGRTPGSAEILTQLRQRQVPMSLLTGLTAERAALQVETVGLDRYLDLDIGGFGSDGTDRSTLLDAAALRMGDKYGPEVDAAGVVVVTDEPADIRAAHVRGMHAVAVCADPDRLAQLRAAGADVELADLLDTEAVLTAVQG